MNKRIVVLAGSVLAAAVAIGATSLSVADASTTATSASPGQLVVIDATKDKDAAVQALTLYKDATDRSFTPTGAPTFSSTDWKAAQGGTANPDGKFPIAPSVSGGKTKGTGLTIDVSHEATSGWSLGGSIEASVGFDLAGVVDAEVSTKFTANHTWESGFRDYQSIKVTADPGKTVWIESSNSEETFSGTFTFAANGIRYEVDNVSFTEPVSADQSGDSINSTTYKVMEMDSSSIGVKPNQTGHANAISSLPKLQQQIATGH